MAIDLENRVIHRFIRNVSAYEVGGEFYAQIIPLDTQAYAIYPNKEDNYLFYVIGDGEHTYSELRAGLGNGEAYREYPVLTNENLNVIVGGIEEEERARKEADLVLENKINEEKSARESEDSLLNESINIIQNNLAQETIDRIEAISNLNSDLQEEKQARISIDNELRSLLNSEIEERKQFDDLLDDALGEEISIRSAADELLSQRITEESESRQSSDRTLEQLISAEETRATQAETALENAKQDVLTAGTGISIENNIISNTQSQTVIEDNLTSYSTTSALSANMGRVLQDEVENVKARGRYLSLWDCATGLAETNPPESPYVYKPGDYFIVGNVAESGSINYKPSGSSYITGEPSSTVEELEVNEDDTYIFDGSNWHIQETSRKTVTFANIAGSPSDNVALNAEFGSKQDILVNQENIKSINGSSLLGSGNLEIASHLEYPSSWPTSSSTTTKQFCDAVAEDDTAIEGKTYLGEVRWSDLPGLVNGEVEVEIMTGTTASSKVIVLTLTSGNQAPYMWKYTYWNGGHNVSGWKGFVPTTEVANRIYGTDLNGNQTTYDKDSFGKIDDVRIDGVSVVSNKIANLGTMASEDSSNYTTTSDLQEGYVAKEPGKGLSTNDYTNADKEKLAGLSNYDDTELSNRVSNLENAGYQTSEQVETAISNKLEDYTTTSDLNTLLEAKANVSDLGTMSAENASDYYTSEETNTAITTATNDMATQTWVGEQLGNYTTTFDLQAGYVAKESGKGLSTNDYSNTDKEKVDSLGTMSTQSASDYSTKAVADTLYADKSLEQTVETHTSNTDIHVTASDKSNWNAKQEALTAGTNVQIQNGVISATDTTYTAGSGIDITNGVISNTQTSAEWGNITGTLGDQTDLQNALDTKLDSTTAASTYATQTALANKADSATTLVGYGITDAYTKTEIDTSLENKVDKLSTANIVYGTDSQGNQTTYAVDSFGAVDDVQVNGTSIVSNKIANFTVDNAPTQSSTNLITSGGVYSAIPSIIMRDWSNNNSNL